MENGAVGWLFFEPGKIERGVAFELIGAMTGSDGDCK